MATQGAASAVGQAPTSASVNNSSTSNAALPQDAQAIGAILRELGVTEFEPRIVSQILDFSYGYVKDVLGEARLLATHAGHKQIDAEDVKVAIQFWSDRSFTTAMPSPAVVAELAHARNSQPLPVPRPTGKAIAGIRLPADRHCLTQASFQLRPQDTSSHTQRYVAASQVPNASAGDQRHPTFTDNRINQAGMNQSSRPSSSFSVAHSGSAMLPDYDM